MGATVIDPERDPEKDLPRKVSGFAQRLMALQVPLGRLSPLESRLLEILGPLFASSVILARSACPPIDECTPARLTEDVVAEGARLAVVAAIEIEQHLRGIREHVEAHR